MKSYLLVLVGGGLIASSLAVGVVHGRLTNRWGIQPDMQEAGRRLKNVPTEFGPWRQVVEHQLNERVASMLQCQGSVNRVYENAHTGQRVHVVVLLGPSGPISVHTPEVCYSSRDYLITDDRIKHTVGDNQDLWDLRLKSNRPGAAQLRVLYGWTNDGNWDATASPRFTYGGRPLLYKIQLSGPVASEPGDQEACDDFLKNFLPVLRPHLLTSEKASKSG
jgi:hypothetical protein